MSPREWSEPRRRWWSPALVIHAVLVLVVVVGVLSPLMGPGAPAAVAGLLSAAELLLGMPWWLVTGFLYLLPLRWGPVSEAVLFLLPLLLNLLAHATVLQAVRAGRRRSAAGAGANPSSHRRPGFLLAVGFLLGALTWAAWLGWDRTASYDVVTGTVQYPYVTLQVLGCALTFGTVTAVLAALWPPVPGAAGVALGFWFVWTVDAASQDDSGLFAVGSMMLAVGLALGTTVAAALGWGARPAIAAVRRRRAAGGRGIGHR